MLTTRSATVRRLLTALDGFGERIPLERLAEILTACSVTAEDVGEAIRFGDRGYCRNLLHAGPAYQALILCWRSGQRSPIHDHRGSSCGVRVLRGVATETRYERGDGGGLVASGCRELAQGTVCATEDADIHEMSNLQPGAADLITLHVYSPPLLRMGTYSLADGTVGEFVDPLDDTPAAGI